TRLQKSFRSDRKSLTLLNRQYAKSLWHHASKDFSEQNYLQALGEFSRAVGVCLKVSTWV
ncbi:MAG TPA: hypothetical protein V6C72_06365, partial [Chroococcales cyanobacterium]